MTSFEAFEVQSHAGQGCSTVELLEEITANSDFCAHIARELLKVCEMHVSLTDLPLHATLSDACTGVITGHSLTSLQSPSITSTRYLGSLKVCPRTSTCFRARARTDTEAGDTVVLPLLPSHNPPKLGNSSTDIKNHQAHQTACQDFCSLPPEVSDPHPHPLRRSELWWWNLMIHFSSVHIEHTTDTDTSALTSYSLSNTPVSPQQQQQQPLRHSYLKGKLHPFRKVMKDFSSGIIATDLVSLQPSCWKVTQLTMHRLAGPAEEAVKQLLTCPNFTAFTWSKHHVHGYLSSHAGNRKLHHLLHSLQLWFVQTFLPLRFAGWSLCLLCLCVTPALNTGLNSHPPPPPQYKKTASPGPLLYLIACRPLLEN